MAITLNTLVKQLQKLQEQGHGRKTVAIDKETFKHPLEGDGVCILDILGAKILAMEVADDDGGMKTRSDGTQCIKTQVVIFGDSE